MALSLTSQQVNEEFRGRYAASPEAATSWFYHHCTQTGYVHAEAITRNLEWNTATCWGDLQITVNRSKPEKDPRDIARAALASRQAAQDSTSPAGKPAPQCALCFENEGYPGRPADDPAGPWPDRSALRIVRLSLGGETWGLQYSPYAYFPEHCIVMSRDHRPMHMDRATLSTLIDCIDKLPHYFFGSNAELPIVGGSILSHDHYQGGLHTFPLQKAPVSESFCVGGCGNVRAGVVAWPVSVIRLACNDREELLGAACKILHEWRAHDDPQVGIVSSSTHDGKSVQHNTVTPIAYKRGETYVLDLALRCNITSSEHPLGVFHPHEELHHVKKENIGLIEVMGRAILPPRLLQQFDGLEHERAVQDEVGKLFALVLEHSGVFKWDDAGRAAQQRFLSKLL